MRDRFHHPWNCEPILKRRPNPCYIHYPGGPSREIAERGEQIYQKLREELEEEHWGLYIVIDVKSGCFEIARSEIQATLRMLSRCGNGIMYARQIGAAAGLSSISRAMTGPGSVNPSHPRRPTVVERSKDSEAEQPATGANGASGKFRDTSAEDTPATTNRRRMNRLHSDTALATAELTCSEE